MKSAQYNDIQDTRGYMYVANVLRNFCLHIIVPQ